MSLPMVNVDVYANDMPPASGWHMHAHADEALLSHALEGSCTQIIASRFWLVLPAHAVWMPPGTAHATQIGPQGCRLRTVAFPVPLPPGLPPEPCVIEVSALLAALIEALDNRDDTDLARTSALRTLVYDEIKRAERLDFSLPHIQDARLLRVSNAMRADPADARGIDAWAKLAGMSRRSFIRHFGQETGMPFAQWQRKLRLLSARQMLAQGVSVTDAALSLGYRSPSAFAAMVRRELGVTPAHLGASKRRDPRS